VMRDETSLARGCLRLLEMARVAGGRDDATVLVVRRRSHAMQRLARTASAGLAIAIIAAALIVAATGAPQWKTGADAPNPPDAHAATPVQQGTERP
jgi:hypothetical protein